MAEQAAENAQSAPAEKKGGKQLILGLAIVPVVTILTFFLTAKFIGPRFAVPAAGISVAAAEEEEDAVEDTGFIWELGTVLANPSGKKSMRIMKVTVSAEFALAEHVEIAEKSREKLKDCLVMILSSKTFEKVSSVEGKSEIKSELKEKFTLELGMEEGDVRQIYFSEFVVQ